MTTPPLQIARWCLGLCWVYQGLAPKLISVAPLEAKLIATMGFSPHISNLVTRGAGVSEVALGVLLIALYKNSRLLLMNMAILAGLLVFSMAMLPSILLEAFNPVTTNLCMIALSYYLWFEAQ